MKFNNICPGCGEIITPEGSSSPSGDRTIRYTCDECKSTIFVRGEDQGISSYFLNTTYNNTPYVACFYFKESSGAIDGNPTFTIECPGRNAPDENWKKILTLPFHPEINSHNFKEKLKAYLPYL